MAKSRIIPNWKDTLFEEKSIYSLIAKSIRIVGGATERKILTLCMAILIAATVIVSFVRPELIANTRVQLEFQHSIAALLFPYASSILGFLIAGFSLVVGIMSTATLRKIAMLKKSGMEISEFKFAYFSFIYVISVFIALTLLSFVIFAISHYQSVLNEILPPKSVPVSTFLLALNILLSGIFVYSIFLIKTFVWNIYQLLLVTIAVDEPANK